jgi:hypothetical protein
MNAEEDVKVQNETRPPVRPVFRKLSWLIAAVGFLMALVAVTGFCGREDRLSMTLIFLFIGFVFTTIALKGYVTPPGSQVNKKAIQTNLVLAAFCLLCFVQGVESVLKPDFVHRLLGWITVVFGGIGIIASIVAILAERRKIAKISDRKE